MTAAKKPPAINIRGIRQSLPSGYVLGRQSPGNGPAELIDMASLASQMVATGTVPAASQVTSVTWPAAHTVLISEDSNSPVGVALADGKILVGQTSGDPSAKAVSGDATLADTGAVTLATVNSDVGSFTSANITVEGYVRQSLAAVNTCSAAAAMAPAMSSSVEVSS